MVPQARVHVGGDARLVEYLPWACVAGPLCGLEADSGDLAHLRRVVVGHAVKEEGSVLKVLPWVVEGAGGLGAGKTSGAGTRGVSLDVVIGGRTGYSNTNGGESSDNRSKVHADCYPAENPSL